MSQFDTLTFQRKHLTVADNARELAARDLETFVGPNLGSGLIVSIAALLFVLLVGQIEKKS